LWIGISGIEKLLNRMNAAGGGCRRQSEKLDGRRADQRRPGLSRASSTGESASKRRRRTAVASTKLDRDIAKTENRLVPQREQTQPRTAPSGRRGGKSEGFARTSHCACWLTELPPRVNPAFGIPAVRVVSWDLRAANLGCVESSQTRPAARLQPVKRELSVPVAFLSLLL
jgi:hypothetical protein